MKTISSTTGLQRERGVELWRSRTACRQRVPNQRADVRQRRLPPGPAHRCGSGSAQSRLDGRRSSG
jgi:hypothetical protein